MDEISSHRRNHRVIYGSPTGLTAARSQSFTRAELSPPSTIGEDPGFGTAVATGDFDADGFCDLAIGDNEASAGKRRETGAVHVLYGSAVGLTRARHQYWTQASPGVPGANEAGDRFGVSLAAGDLGRGDYADLVIGTPFENVDDHDSAGAVTVLYGSARGLTSAGSQSWTQDSPGVRGAVEKLDQFGESLAIADFNGTGPDDVAIGIPYESLDGVNSAGGVAVLFSSTDGLGAAGNQFLRQGAPGVLGQPESEDAFGYELVAGHFAGHPSADLAVFILNEYSSDGAVQVFYGATTGLTATGNQLLSSRTPGFPPATQYARVGEPLAAADFGRNRGATPYDDLAFGYGAYGGPPKESGSVLVLYGGPSGLQVDGFQSWSQDTPGVPGTSEAFDGFGAGLAGADVGSPTGGPGYADLVIGSPQEKLGGVRSAGRIHVLYGSDAGLSTNGLQTWNESQLGGRLTTNAEFGLSIFGSGP